MTTRPRRSARGIPAVPACLPFLALALSCSGIGGEAMAGQTLRAGWNAPGAAGIAAPAGGVSVPLFRRVAEEEDEQAELPPGAKVSREQAASIALKAVAGEVTAVDVERKRGRIVYTVEIMTPQGDETDVLVDIETGEVLGTE